MTMLSFHHHRTRTNARSVNAGIALAGFAAGAACLALLEPRGGARRRGRVVQKTIHARKSIRAFSEKAARDLANRSRGLIASVRSVGDAGAPDDVLRERVRSGVGRLTAHPSAIEVFARDGVVELRGPILEAEVQQVLRGTRRVRGVRAVVDHLVRHVDAGEVSALQGGPAQRAPVPDAIQASWAPGTRLVAIVLGAALAVIGSRSRRLTALPLGLVGVSLALRGLTNLPLSRLLGIGARRGALDLRKKSLLERGRAEGVTREAVRPLDAFDPGL